MPSKKKKSTLGADILDQDRRIKDDDDGIDAILSASSPAEDESSEAPPSSPTLEPAPEAPSARTTERSAMWERVREHFGLTDRELGREIEDRRASFRSSTYINHQIRYGFQQAQHEGTRQLRDEGGTSISSAAMTRAALDVLEVLLNSQPSPALQTEAQARRWLVETLGTSRKKEREMWLERIALADPDDDE